jgi:malonate-semialdehyde dehydrogenase (acetylating)/methylmalonate-semialdehyde dehydrogenase
MQLTHWIDNSPVTTAPTRTSPVTNPATGHQSATVPLASSEEVDAAVTSSLRAYKTWSQTSLSTRTRFLFKYRELLDANRNEIAELITAQHGKVLSDAAGELARGIEVLEFACGIPQLLKGAHSSGASGTGPTGVDVTTLRRPLGPVAGITPFNFPAMVPMWMFPIALACGNTFILKPSEKDPAAAQRLVELAAEAGLPPGVLNLIHGDRTAVDRLLTHPDIAAVSFVGSTPIAQHVYETGTAHGKRVQALGGAKNHMVVLPDADLDQAADAAVSAAYGSAGERCMAVSVVVAVGDTGDDLVSRIAARARAVKIGPGNDPASEMGPLITREHRDRVAGYVTSGGKQGADVIVDGTGLSVEGHPDGHFIGVSLLDRVTPAMDCYRDEIFGPVLTVVRADSYDEALHLVNSNPWGNGAAVFTRDGGAARRFQLEATAGMIGVNVPIPVPVAYHSFGGWKASLFGDTHAYGTDGVHFYTRGKVVTSRWPDPAERGVDLGFPQNN